MNDHIHPTLQPFLWFAPTEENKQEQPAPVVQQRSDSPYGHGRACGTCGGTETGDSWRGYVGKCNCGSAC